MGLLRRNDERAAQLDARAAQLDERAERLAAAERRMRPIDPAQHEIPGYPNEVGPVTKELYDRLSEDDVAEVRSRLEGVPAEAWAGADEVGRAYLTLHFGVHYSVPAVLEKTGLTADAPPEAVHAMARGPMAAGGDPALADLVVGALARAGRELPAEVLDFGCSSGRVLRVLTAVRPDVRWHGCDPNAPAVRWAAEHVPGASFQESPLRPPLDRPTGSLDLVYAISIWSHFDASPALAWLSEMYRLLRPGGLLLLSAHGLAALARHVSRHALAPDDGARCAEALQRSGFWFAPTFGEAGDAGVRDAEWGSAYLTPEWLVARMLPRWSLLLYEPGRLEGTQDVYLFERR